jgi:hypothetical protein
MFFVQKMKSVSEPGKYLSRTVDFKDHLGGAIHHLRFLQNKWESSAIYNSDIYTNRLRFSEWMNILGEGNTVYQILWKNIHLFL